MNLTHNVLQKYCASWDLSSLHALEVGQLKGNDLESSLKSLGIGMSEYDNDNA